MRSIMKEETGTRPYRRHSRMLLQLGVLILMIAAAGVWGAVTAKSAAAYQTGPSVPASPAAPEAVCPPDGQCFADVPPSNPFYGSINNLYRQDIISGYACWTVPEGCGAWNRPYFRPGGIVTRSQVAKFVDLARTQPGIFIDTPSHNLPLFTRTTVGGGSALYAEAPNGNGVVARSNSRNDSGIFAANSGGGFGIFSTSTGVGVRGESTGNADGVVGRAIDPGRSGVLGYNEGNGNGVYGQALGGGYGVFGVSAGNNGVQGTSSHRDNSGVYGVHNHGGYGVAARSNGTGIRAALFAENFNGGAGAYAGYFAGHVEVTGACCAAAAGTYKIDHPQDPANRYLLHSAVASPDMMNVYNGNVTTDDKGEAAVQLPAYFEALNRDFRYQLTTIGERADAWVASEIKSNSFTIKTDKPGVKVSWQVTGIRHDAFADQYRTPAETDKPAEEKGYYRHPELFGQPADKSVVKAQQE